MHSQKSIIVSSEREVSSALEKIGLSPQLVRIFAEAAAGARAEALSIDPSGAAGMFSYIYGVRAIRLSLLSKGWRENRDGNVESTINDELGVRLCFQNVDIACSTRDPRAISTKGSASRRLVAAGQGELFDTKDKDSDKFGSMPTVWVVCVSADENSIRAEVSCPTSFEGSQFEGFHQRIFVLNESFDPAPKTPVTDTDEAGDFDVHISKK